MIHKFLALVEEILMNRDDSRLVFHDIPILLWIFGLIFAGVGAAIIYEGGGASAMGLIFAAIGLSALLFASALTITADRVTRTLKLEYRSALRQTLKQVSFDEIAGFNIERSVSRNQGTYRVVVTRKDGQVIPFRSYSSSGSRRKERQAGQLRDFIGVQALQPHAAEIRETNGVHWQIQPMAMGEGTRTRWYSPDFKTADVFLFVAQKAKGQASGGFLASLGSMFFKQSLSMWGFQAADTPGLDRAAPLAPLDPALEPHFMAFTNDPATALKMLNSRAVAQLADWAGRYPLKQFQMGSRASQLVTLFGPNGVYLATMNQLPPDQMNELAALGVELVKAQGSSRGPLPSAV
jgi:hypothetical protein